MASVLFVRSVYSLLSSMCEVTQAVSLAREKGYQAIGMVDKNVLAYAPSFKKVCLEAGIKAIYGLEIEVSLNERTFGVVLYAKNDDGFKNLMALSSLLNTSEEKVLDITLVKKYFDNNFVVLLSDDSPLSIAYDKNEDLEKAFQIQAENFGSDYLFALCDHDYAINLRRDKELKKLLKQKGITTFCFSRTFYLYPEDCKEFEILKCIRDKRILAKTDVVESGRYLLDFRKLNELYDQDDIANGDVLASKCNVNLDFHTSLPTFKTPNGVSSKDYLYALCKEGLKRRLKGNINNDYLRRLEYELKTIVKMEFENYFLIVYDFILFAKKNNIMVGPGRGSSAGSLVSYCLGITDIDPLKNGLFFERFLNPERISLPDIDTDFPDDKRDLVVNYVKEKYGENHVAHIITYGTLKAKQVLRDVGRVLNYSTLEMDSICKLIPFMYANSLQMAYGQVPLFKQKIDSDVRYQNLFNIACKLEGFPRHESTHAAGIVMSLLPLEEVVPLIRVENDVYSTQYTMEHLEELGLIKMDFLGLRNLGIMAEIVEDINKDLPFDINNIPFDDRKTFELIDDVNLLGVFQLESNGMQNLARKMRPNSLNELSMMIALFRPGPMDNIPQFLQNRANPNKITYLVEELRPILQETYGIIVYQEQIMLIATTLAGFSFGKADVLRRAMSKKKASELIKLKDEFIEGCVNNHYSRDLAMQLYEYVLAFANYGFNKAHSFAYGVVAYKMAYLKANFPLYFYKALLNGSIGSQSKTYEYINECRLVGLSLLGVSINHSFSTYTIEDNNIRLPLSICKDVGVISIQKIVGQREMGLFKDYLDCVCRLSNSGVDKNVLESLIYAGAFDEFGYSRHTMFKALGNCLKYASAHKNDLTLIDLADAPIIEQLADDKMVACENEKAVLGFYFSFNPLNDLKRRNNIDTLPLKQIGERFGSNDGFGMIKRIKTHKTKRGDLMAFVDVGDDSGDLSLVIMPDLYRQFESDLVKGNYLAFSGNVDKEASLLVRRLRRIQ